MKRFFAMILVFVAALTLVGCGEKEFKHDGEFTAFKVETHGGAPMVTSVTVTVEKGKVVKYYIDCRQGTSTKDGETFTAVAWNEKTKKELGFEYKMHWPGFAAATPNEADQTLDNYKEWLKTSKLLEWHEQAEALEAHFLANGTTLTKDEGGYIQGVAGVSIKDGGYSELAAEAVANAKAGKVITFQHTDNYGTPNLVWVTLTLDEKGKAKELVVDTLQAKLDATTGLIWNEKSKQELGFEYKMHWPGFAAATPNEADQTLDNYKEWLKTSKLLEWHEQVKLVTDDILANGVKAEPSTPVAGVTIITSTYYALINAAYKAAGLK